VQQIWRVIIAGDRVESHRPIDIKESGNGHQHEQNNQDIGHRFFILVSAFGINAVEPDKGSQKIFGRETWCFPTAS
jgi:hypothetical protein